MAQTGAADTDQDYRPAMLTCPVEALSVQSPGNISDLESHCDDDYCPPLRRANSEPHLSGAIDGQHHFMLSANYAANQAAMTADVEYCDIDYDAPRRGRSSFRASVASVGSYAAPPTLFEKIEAGVDLGQGGDLLDEMDEVELMDLDRHANEDVAHHRLRIEQIAVRKDKVTYLLCCVLAAVLAFFLFSEGFHMELMCTHTFIYCILYAIRYYLYRKAKWQFFLIDVCYFVNLLIILWAFFFPKDARIFLALYSFSNGLPLWSVVLYRNSIVPHSLDKLTSCYLHLMPAVLLFKFRWLPSPHFSTCTPHEDRYLTVFVSSNCQGMSESDVQTFIYLVPLGIYCFHAIAQQFILTVHPSIRNDPAYLTGTRYILRDPKSLAVRITDKIAGTLWKGCKCCPYGPFRTTLIELFKVFLFFVEQLPTYLIFRSFWINITVLTCMLTFAAWNGATFYIDTFAVRYSNQHNHYYSKRMIKRGLLRTVGTQCHHQG